MATKERQIVVRIGADIADKLDAYAEQLRRDQPGPKWSTSDIVRKLLANALEEIEVPRKRRG